MNNVTQVFTPPLQKICSKQTNSYVNGALSQKALNARSNTDCSRTALSDDEGKG